MSTKKQQTKIKEIISPLPPIQASLSSSSSSSPLPSPPLLSPLPKSIFAIDDHNESIMEKMNKIQLIPPFLLHIMSWYQLVIFGMVRLLLMYNTLLLNYEHQPVGCIIEKVHIFYHYYHYLYL